MSRASWSPLVGAFLYSTRTIAIGSMAGILLLTLPWVGMSPTLARETSGLTYVTSTAGGKVLSSQEVVALCTPANCLFVDYSGEVFGSGVLIHPSGIVMTNIHVLRECGADGVQVQDWQRRPLEIQGILAYNLLMDWVALKVRCQHGDTTHLFYATIGDPKQLQPGETVLAIGNGAGYTNTPSFGPVHNPSERDGTFPEPVIRHGAAITGGNSGGGLFNPRGELVGLNTMSIASMIRPLSNLCFAIPIDKARLPIDTAHVISPDCFCRFLRAHSLVNSNDNPPDWKDAADVLLRMPSGCTAIPEAGLLLARCYIELQKPSLALQLIEQMKPDSKYKTAFAHLKGLAWTASAVSDSIPITEARDSVLVCYNFLKSLDDNRADSLLVCLRKLNDLIQLQVTGKSAEVPNNSIVTEDLTAVEQHLLGRYGPNGVRVFQFMEGARPSSDLLQEPSLTQLKLLEILDGMRSEGVVKIDPFYRVQEPGVGSSDSEEENPAEIASFLRSLYLHELRVDREPRRAIPLIKECLKWTNDADDLETDHLNLATASSMIDNYAAAESLLTYSITMLSPDDPIAYGNRAAIRRNMRCYREAEQDYRIALRLLEKSSVDRDSTYAASMCRYQFGLARVLLRQGRSAEARDLFQEIVASDMRWKDGPVKYPEFIQTPTDSVDDLNDWKKLGAEKK